MKNLMGMLMLILLLACGMPQENSQDTMYTNINIDCFSVSNSENEACKEISGEVFKEVVFDSGDISIDQPVFGNFIVSNSGTEEFNGWHIVPTFINGCGGMGYITKEISIPAGFSINDMFGGATCNALEGYQEYTVSLYEGEMPMNQDWNSMWDDSCCNNTWDWEVLDSQFKLKARATVRYNYVQ